MLEQLLFLFLAAALSALFYPFWIGFVYKYQMGEEIRMNGPQTHFKKSGTPTMGGLVFIIVVAAVTFLFNRSRTQTIFPVFVASMAGLFGIMEDLAKIYARLNVRRLVQLAYPAYFKLFFVPWAWFKEFWRIVGSSTDVGLQTYQKFLIQAAIGGFVSLWAYFKLSWDYIWLPLIGEVHIGFLYPVAIFLLFIVILNSVAFTDGLDGLAGGLAIIALLAFWVISSFLGYNMLASFSATFVGALLPFLYFNIYPARIFMGNVGAHVLGAVLTTLAVIMHREFVLLFVCGVFLFDGISSPLQQLSAKLTKKRIFRMAPAHHHFELLGWQEAKVTLRFWLVGALLSFVGIFVALL